MKISIKKFLILVFVMFLGLSGANADNSYKNELKKVSLSPIGSGDVKVTLYMAKPYSEPLRILKKNDGEFVLILPETYNSAPQKPSISDVINEVTDADVKLYSFVSNSSQNGYTKIVIKTNGLVNLYPESVVTGGGVAVNKVQQEVNKIVAEKIKPVITPIEVVKKNDIPVNKTISEKKQSVQEPKLPPKTEVKKPEVKSAEQQAVSKKTNVEAKTAEEEMPVVTLPKLSTEQKEIAEVPLEEVVSETPKIVQNTNVDKKENKIKILFANLKNIFVSNKSPLNLNFSGLKKQSGNILIILVSLILVFFSAKFAVAIIKSAKNKEDETPKEQDNSYSEFFKTLIDSEIKGNNPFSIADSANDVQKIETTTEPAKSHEEVLNIDQNLTWQEKFRALQNNKKSLLKEDDKYYPMEISEDMNIENPIKKLTQDFKAVKKVLERQKEKLSDSDSINQDFEKIDKVEVISFEDYQKRVEKPKVQMNKTLPIKAKAPKIITQLALAEGKGFYLVEYKNKISLIGYVKDKVFRLNSYASIRDTKLYARLSDKTDKNETYIVKFDNNKMLVDVDEEQMKLKLLY